MQQCLVKEVPNITVIVAWGSIQQCIVRHIWSVVMWYSSRERVFIVQIFLKDPVHYRILSSCTCFDGNPDCGTELKQIMCYTQLLFWTNLMVNCMTDAKTIFFSRDFNRIWQNHIPVYFIMLVLLSYPLLTCHTHIHHVRWPWYIFGQRSWLWCRLKKHRRVKYVDRLYSIRWFPLRL